MPNTLGSPVTGLSDLSPETSAKRPRLQAVPPPQPSNLTAESTVLPIPGPRKLVRPTLPGRAFRNRTFLRRDDPPVLTNQRMGGAMPVFSQESSNTEAFYFQKQMQTQTQMVIVLEDGQQLEGCIEWYDRNTIKVRGTGRTLVYKSAIKYMYKAGERHS
ncbi:MAG TPA: RNA chaperone Hfq [Acidobacteriaceae bacterium]|nr:RNA chaperone Hfq [Acidobacteriaceae bacterium]